MFFECNGYRVTIPEHLEATFLEALSKSEICDFLSANIKALSISRKI